MVEERPRQTIGRSVPHSAEAEEYLLGCCLLDGADTIARCLEAKLPADAFYAAPNRIIYEKMCELYQKAPPVAVAVLAEELKTSRQLDAIGGYAYLSHLSGRIPTTAQSSYFIDKVRELHLLREIIKVATSTVENCFNFSGGIEEFIDQVEQNVFKVTQDRVSDAARTMKEPTVEAMAVIQKMMMKKGELTGVSSGFKDLDTLTWGFQRQEMIILAARPSMGKCLAHDSEVLLADGSMATMGTLHARKQAKLLTLNSELKFQVSEPSDYVDDGLKPVFRVTTRLGRTVEATLPHPFLTVEGWTKLQDLKPGQAIAVPRELPIFGTKSLRECEVKLLAYLLGDGTITRSSPLFSNGNDRLRTEFAESAAAFGGCITRPTHEGLARTPTLRVSSDRIAIAANRKAFGGRLEQRLIERGMTAVALAELTAVSPSLVSGWTNGNYAPGAEVWEKLIPALQCDETDLAPAGLESISKNSRNPVALWLKQLGLDGCDAYEKFVPADVFTLPREQLALFLNRLFATDGWASVSKWGASQVGYASVSEKLARQTAHLLLRFGVLASVKPKKVGYQGEVRKCFQVIVTDQASLQVFCSEIGIFGKEEAVERVRAESAGKRSQTNRDLIPREIWKKIALAKGGESWSSLARRAGVEGHANIHAGKRSISRLRLGKLAAALHNEELTALSQSKVYWDEIISIEPVGNKQVYDLTVPETHNFVANDLCVHNTSLALNFVESAAMPKKGEGTAVLLFSLEMSASQLAMRMLCSRARVNLKLLREGLLSKNSGDMDRLVPTADEFSKAPIFIDDSSHLSIMELRAKARRVHARKKLGLIVVDYLQLLSPTDSSVPREQQVAEASRGLKALAKELDLPVIVLSQLNRSSEKENRTPKLADLRESGSIEQDADVVLMLARPKDADEKFQVAADSAELIVAKQRNGPVGELRLTFLRDITRFENYTQ